MISNIGFRGSVVGRASVDINKPIKELGLKNIPTDTFKIEKAEPGTIFQTNNGQLGLITKAYNDDQQSFHFHWIEKGGDGSTQVASAELLNKVGIKPFFKLNTVKISD